LGAVEVEIATGPSRGTSTARSKKGRRLWVLCGMKRMAAAEPGDDHGRSDDGEPGWENWVAILQESEDGTLPQLATGFQGTGLRTPHTLIDVSLALRAELQDRRASLPRTCQVPTGDGTDTHIAFAATPSTYNGRGKVRISATIQPNTESERGQLSFRSHRG